MNIIKYLKNKGYNTTNIQMVDKENKNNVCFFELEDKRYVFKQFVRKIYGGHDPLERELTAQDIFLNEGIPFPEINHVDLDNRVIIKRFIEGRTPKNMDDYLLVTNFLKNLHSIDIDLSKLFYRKPEDLIE